MNIASAACKYGLISHGTYDIGFTNSDGMEDETEFTVDDLPDLEKCFSIFCKENNVDKNNVLYVRRVGDLTVRELNRDQLNQLKESLVILKSMETLKSVGINELMCSCDLITDEEVYEYYEGVLFSEEDFYS